MTCYVYLFFISLTLFHIFYDIFPDIIKSIFETSMYFTFRLTIDTFRLHFFDI